LVPAPLNGTVLGPLPAAARDVAARLDAAAGRALSCLVAVEGDSLRLLSARPVQLSAAAELEAAVDRVDRGVWSADEAVARIEPARLQQLLHPRLKSPGDAEIVASGL